MAGSAAPEDEGADDTSVDPVLDSVLDPVLDSVPDPVLDSVPDPVLDSVPDPVLDSVPDPVLDSVLEGAMLLDMSLVLVIAAVDGALEAAGVSLPHALSTRAIAAVPARAATRSRRKPLRSRRTVITILFDSVHPLR